MRQSYYKLKFGKIVKFFNKLKPVVEKAKSFDVTDRNGKKKRRYRNNQRVYFTWKDTEREGMEPQKKICTKKVFNNPVFPQKVKADLRVRTFFRKPWFESWNGTDPEEYLKDFNRNQITCVYQNAHIRWTERGFEAAGGRG